MGVVLLSILLILNVINVVLHCMGSCVLLHLYPKSRQKAQQLYLIHLSISECLMNLLEAVRILTKLATLQGDDTGVGENIRHYVLIVAFTGVSFIYYSDMTYITIDRLMIMALNTEYSVHWNEKKAKCLLLGTWLLGTLIATTVTICNVLLDFQWESIFFKYFYPIVEFLFIVLALTTYGFIIRKYRQKALMMATTSRKPGNCSRKPGGNFISQFTMCVYCANRSHNETFRSIKKSVFCIPVLLITTFLIFMVIPDLIYLFVAIIQNHPSELLSEACWLSYAVSNLIDVSIYIFLQRDVRKFLKQKMSFSTQGEKVSHEIILRTSKRLLRGSETITNI